MSSIAREQYVPFESREDNNSFGFAKKVIVLTIALVGGGLNPVGAAPSNSMWSNGSSATSLVPARSQYVREVPKPSDRKAILKNVADATDSQPPMLIASIRDNMHISLSDIAKATNVTRQTVHLWQSGKSVSPEKFALLKSLHSAALMFKGVDKSALRALTKRNVGGKTFFESISRGESGLDVASKFLGVLHLEAEQVEVALQDRKAKDKVSTITSYDLGLPRYLET